MPEPMLKSWLDTAVSAVPVAMADTHVVPPSIDVSTLAVQVGVVPDAAVILERIAHSTCFVTSIGAENWLVVYVAAGMAMTCSDEAAAHGLMSASERPTAPTKRRIDIGQYPIRATEG